MPVALAADPADDLGDVVEPMPAEVTAEPAALPALDPRLAPEPTLDPFSDEQRASDPADESATPSGEAFEHDPYATGEMSLPPFSASLDCPLHTTERRSPGDDGAELSCVDERGRRHGPLVRLHPSGTPKLRGTYVGGRRHGVFLAWFPSGRLEGRSAYQHGLEHGLEELYYESGRLRARTTYQEGKKHGRHLAWHENGKIAADGTYVHGEAAEGWVLLDEEGRAIEPAALASGTTTEDEGTDAQGPPLSSKLVAAAAGGVGATMGLALGVPAAFLLVELGAFAAVDPNGWLPLLLVPPLFAAAGGALGTVLFTRFPGAVMAGAGAAFGIPAGGALGGLVGGALAGTFALGVLALGASSDTSLGLVTTGAVVGAVAGAAVGPAAFAAFAGWLYADEPKGAE